MYSLVIAGLTMVGIVLRSLFPRAPIFAWTAPDFLLLVVVYNAMFSGAVHGGVIGFLIGLAEDFSVGRMIGLNAMAKCAAGMFCGYFSKAVYKENIWIPVINVFFGSIISRSIVLIAGYLTGARWNLTGALFSAAFELVLSVCLVPFTYGVFFKKKKKYNLDDDEAK